MTAASVQERAGAKLLFQRLTGACKKLRRIWLDGGYRHPSLMTWIAAHCRFCLQIVMCSDDQREFMVLPRRWVVEGTLAWLNHYRRLSKDYEGRTSSSEAFIYIAMPCIMLRRLA